jgi:hypothetical protein
MKNFMPVKMDDSSTNQKLPQEVAKPFSHHFLTKLPVNHSSVSTGPPDPSSHKPQAHLR